MSVVTTSNERENPTRRLAPTSKMRESIALGMELWNDSCAEHELRDAVDIGAVGATSNPVIVAAAVEQDRTRYLPVIDALVRAHRTATEDELAWMLIGVLVREGAAVLHPQFVASEGRCGVLCAQVCAKLWRDTERMVAHGLELAALAPNVAIKVPLTGAGVGALEELTARGIHVNATVSFTVSQAVAGAEAIERGLARARAAGLRVPRPVITLMIGRIDDHVKRVVDQKKLTVDPSALPWAGIAVFKNALRVFRAQGFAATLLSAAYRHHLHWSELVGPGIVQTIPYAWWRQLDECDVVVRAALEEPVPAHALGALRSVPDFCLAHDEGALEPEAFARYGASVHTLRQFLDGYAGLVQIVRERMLP